MHKQFAILFLVSMLLSGIATLVYTRKIVDTQKVKSIWIKYVVYILLIASVSFILFLQNPIFKQILMLLLAIRSLYELYTISNKLKNKLLLIFPIIIITCSSIYVSFMEFPNILIYVFVFMFDGFSQIGGQLFGKLKIAPTISSGKTLAGLVCGSLIAITGFTYLMQPQLAITIMPLKYFLLCVFLILGCYNGDLGASYLKRQAGIKDFKTIFPGHGGVLDRFDSFYGCFFMVFIFQFFQR